MYIFTLNKKKITYLNHLQNGLPRNEDFTGVIFPFIGDLKLQDLKSSLTCFAH